MAYSVGQCVAEARVILQDTVVPHRYSDEDLYANLNTALLEARRLRPDLFLADLFGPPPRFLPEEHASAFPVSTLYTVAFINYLVGRAELRDDQFNSDARANALLTSFKAQLSTNSA